MASPTAYARSKVMAGKGLESFADKSFAVRCFPFATACGASYRLGNEADTVSWG